MKGDDDAIAMPDGLVDAMPVIITHVGSDGRHPGFVTVPGKNGPEAKAWLVCTNKTSAKTSILRKKRFAFIFILYIINFNSFCNNW